MKEIIATNRKVHDVLVYVSDEDYLNVSQHRWYADFNKNGKLARIKTKIKINGCVRTIPMTKYILNIIDSDGKNESTLMIGHRNGNKADHTRENIYIKGRMEYFKKENTTENNPSKLYKGVSYIKAIGKYRASFVWTNETFELGLFNTPEEAAVAFDKKAIEFVKCDPSSSLLNFPKIQHTYADATKYDESEDDNTAYIDDINIDQQ